MSTSNENYNEYGEGSAMMMTMSESSDRRGEEDEGQVMEVDAVTVTRPSCSSTSKTMERAVNLVEKNEKNAGEGSNEDSRNPLEVSVVVREVLKYLPPKDLMECSLVNKLWNAEARKILRDHHRVVVTMKDGLFDEDACNQLKELSQDLRRCKSIPFTHLKIYDPSYHKGLMGCCKITGATFEALLKVDWKGIEIVLSVFNGWSKWKEGTCKAIPIINRILKEKSGSLEELRFQYFPPGLIAFETLEFPKLKIAEFGAKFYDDLVPYFDEKKNKKKKTSLEDFLTRLVVTSPNLTAFNTLVSLEDVKSLPDPMLKLIKRFDFGPVDENDQPVLSKLIEEKPRLVEVVATNWNYFSRHRDRTVTDETLFRWVDLIQFLEGNHCKTLKRLETDLVVAAVATEAGLRCLGQVRELTLLAEDGVFVDKRSSEEGQVLIKMLQVFFRQVVPNVEKVGIEYAIVGDLVEAREGEEDDEGGWDSSFWNWMTSDEVVDFVDSALEMPDAEDNDHAGINEGSNESGRPLELECPFEAANFIGPSLRNVSKLHLNALFEHVVPVLELGTVYKFWPNLVELSLEETKGDFLTLGHRRLVTIFDMAQANGDITKEDLFFTLDAVLCGISAAEAAELQKKKNEEGFLQAVHIVPTNPGLTSFSKLKRFNLKLMDSVEFGHSSSEKRGDLPTKVTGLLVFKRLPQVEVSVRAPYDLTRALEDDPDYRDIYCHRNVDLCEREDDR